MNTFSVVVPVFRGMDTLETIVKELTFQYNDCLKEIIFVFDNGNIPSWENIKDLSKKYNLVKGVRLSRNYGQHNATICGFKFATGDFIVTIDEDLQHNPLGIKLLINKQVETDADLVYGVYEEKKHSGFRNFTSYLLNRLLKYGIPELHNDYSSYRLIRTEVAKKTLEMNNSYTFLDGYLTWFTTKVSSVNVTHYQSQSGKSSYTLKKLIEHSINIFVTFSNLPIRILSIFSILFFLSSSFYSLYIILNVLSNKNYAAGFPTIVVMLGFGFGFILLGLGIIGEYIQRINLKSTNRPNFSIKEVI